METTRTNAENVESVRTVDENTPHEFSSPRHFSDVVLVVEGTRFHVHKSTLSRWSPVFETMFQSQFLERTAREIPLPGKCAEEVEQLLKVIYSDDAKQEVTETNYKFLLELAREYQMEKVQQHCAQFMGKGINDKNCLRRYKIAEQFGLEDVMEKCNEEAHYKFSYELESSADFHDLGFESKFKICMARMKDLEVAIRQYSEVSSILVSRYYEEFNQSSNGQLPATFQCINKASHPYLPLQNERRVRKKFDSSCKHCRKRMVSRHRSELLPIDALDFDDLFIELGDLENDKNLLKLL